MTNRMTRRAVLPRRTWYLVFFSLLVSVLFLPGCSKYDVLIDKEQICDQRWADIEAQLQRRYDLVPNLVATVKGSADARGEDARQGDRGPRAGGQHQAHRRRSQRPREDGGVPEGARPAQGLALAALVVQEHYPDLKANQRFHDLQVQLEGTENRILRSREQYNEAVRDYNAELGKIGGSAVNKVTGKPFKPRVYFTAAAGAAGGARGLLLRRAMAPT